jgi:hypothetical protein
MIRTSVIAAMLFAAVTAHAQQSTPRGDNIARACKSAASNDFQRTMESASLTLKVTSRSSPAVNGVYAIHPDMQQKIQQVALYVSINGKFPARLKAMPWPDAAGKVHVFNSPAIFREFASAAIDAVMVFDCQLTVQSATIP